MFAATARRTESRLGRVGKSLEEPLSGGRVGRRKDDDKKKINGGEEVTGAAVDIHEATGGNSMEYRLGVLYMWCVCACSTIHRLVVARCTALDVKEAGDRKG